MEYFLNKTEKIEPECWVWGVVYKDDTELHQFSDGVFTQIKNIEWDKVKMLTMYKLEEPSRRIDLVVDDTMQVFLFYRNVKPYYSEVFFKVYVFGYKIKGTSDAMYNFILPDDRIMISNKENVDLVNFELNR
jgi:hypothetical protein